MIKKVLSITFCLFSIFCCFSQDSIYQNIVYSGTTIEDAVKFEKSINSKLDKSFAVSIILAPELYPYVDKYNLANPKEFSRRIPKNIPGNVEYFYDKNSREIKYVTYKWAFSNKVDEQTLFNRTKLKELVEKECTQLEAYTKLFIELREQISKRYQNTEKKILENLPRKKLIEWENENSKGVLSLEFQDCSESQNLLPGWFRVTFIEYSK